MPHIYYIYTTSKDICRIYRLEVRCHQGRLPELPEQPAGGAGLCAGGAAAGPEAGGSEGQPGDGRRQLQHQGLDELCGQGGHW